MTGDRQKIAFIIDDLGYGGAQRQLSILAAGLSRFYDPLVCCLSSTTRPFGAYLRERRVPVVEIQRRSHFDLFRLGEIRKTLLRERADVVHGFLDAANVYAYFSARAARLPVVLSLRNERLRLHGLRASVLRYAMRKADRVMVNSRAGLRYLTDTLNVPPEKLFMVRNAVPQAPEGSLPGRPGGRPPAVPTVGFVGRLTGQKRVDLLVESFAILRARRPGARLVLVGDGEQRGRLASLVSDRGIEDAVEMTGAVDDVRGQIERFSCLVLPSEFEGMPNAALEALSAGVPVLASAVGDVEEIVMDGRTGYLIRDGSPAGIASLLEKTLADDSLRRSAEVEGPKLIKERFSLDAALDELRAVYSSLASR